MRTRWMFWPTGEIPDPPAQTLYAATSRTEYNGTVANFRKFNTADGSEVVSGGWPLDLDTSWSSNDGLYVAVDGNGDVILTVQGWVQNIRKYDSDGNLIWSAVSGPGMIPNKVVVDDDNAVYVRLTSTTGHRNVRKIDINGNNVWTLGLGAGILDTFTDIAVHGNFVYCTGYGYGVSGSQVIQTHVAVVNKTTGNLQWSIHLPAQLNLPLTGIALDSAGNMCVVGERVYTTPRISTRKLSPAPAGSQLWWADDNKDMHKVAINAMGEIYVGSSTFGGLRRYSDAGSFLSESSDTHKRVYSIAVDEVGTVYTGGLSNVHSGFTPIRKYTRELTPLSFSGLVGSSVVVNGIALAD